MNIIHNMRNTSIETYKGQLGVFLHYELSRKYPGIIGIVNALIVKMVITDRERDWANLLGSLEFLPIGFRETVSYRDTDEITGESYTWHDTLIFRSLCLQISHCVTYVDRAAIQVNCYVLTRAPLLDENMVPVPYSSGNCMCEVNKASTFAPAVDQGPSTRSDIRTSAQRLIYRLFY